LQDNMTITPARSASPPNKPIQIIPIHGTWGRLRFSFWRQTPFWFEENSQFMTRLRAQLRSLGLDVEINPLPWSGANSVAARHSAAFELVHTLWQQRWENPDVHQVVIGHSHGGSVALLAMRDF
jgi:hypothetical protein